MELLISIAVAILLVVVAVVIMRLAPQRLFRWLGAALLAYLLVAGVIYVVGIHGLHATQH